MNDEEPKGLTRLTQEVHPTKCLVTHCGKEARETLLVSGKAPIGHVSFQARLCARHIKYVKDGYALGPFKMDAVLQVCLEGLEEKTKT